MPVAEGTRNRKSTRKGYTTVYEPSVEEIIFTYPDSHLEPEDKLTEKEKNALLKKKIRRLTRRRFFETVVCVGLIIMVGFFVWLLIYPQMELSEISRDNSDLKDEISVLKKQILDSEEDMNGITDIDSVRAQALALGMQDPNSNQVVYIPVPADDKLVTVVSYDAYGVSADAYRNAVDNLSEYYMHKDAEEAENAK
ncbi:MAG: hypothetical protein IKT14_02555 [Clostridiales bacterium]|nr:hypothetical protein [Clostridiales bacterium]MBR6483877.1 hypothetical protein [Clostridiales bacterium]